MTLRPRRCRQSVLLVALLVVAGPGSAHTSGASYSDWTLTESGADVRARASQLDLTRLQLHPGQTDYLSTAGRALAGGLLLRAENADCAAGPVRTVMAADGWVRASWSISCTGHGARTIEAPLFALVAPGHLHFARAHLPTGERRERVLSGGASRFTLPDETPPTFAHDVALGVEHIVLGWDHLAFVLALLLLAGSLREMVLIATGFTLAHSVTLAAAALGVVRTQAAWVEGVIAFSIALAAVEVLWQNARGRWMPAVLLALLGAFAWRLPPLLLAGLALFTACYFALMARTSVPARVRLAMSLLFGLVHGFGFASALQAVALPQERLVAGLLGFNVGVELGQLFVVLVAWPLLRSVPAGVRGWTRDGLAAGLCGLGVYAFVIRVMGAPT